MFLKVDDIHELYIEEFGNPKGEAVVYLHGGPGGSISERDREFFNPEKHRVILFDQRGCGKSKPFGELKKNDIYELVEDVEKIRRHFGIDKWHLFGGSFGSTLALSYAIKYPGNVKSMILRGIFLGRNEDISWLYQDGASYFFPDFFSKFRDFIDDDKRDDLVSAYYEIFTSDEQEKIKKAALIWSRWEAGIVKLIPEIDESEVNDHDITIALLECHFFANHMFWEDDNYILNNIDRIKDIKTYIVHGRYDVDCRPIGAYQLNEKLNDSELYFIDAAGHSSREPGMKAKLIEIMEGIGTIK